jgi:hypothetical protein
MKGGDEMTMAPLVHDSTWHLWRCKVGANDKRFGGNMVVFQIVKHNVIALLLTLFAFTFAHAAPVVYVGNVDGTDAKVAIVVEDGNVLGYACGGNVSWSTHSSWFPVNDRSVLGDGSFKLTGTNGHVLQGLYTPDSAEGTLTLPDGTELAWSASVAAENTPAGLYLFHEKSEEVEDLVGFIVTNELQSVGNIRHILPRSSTTIFAPVGLAQALPAGTADSVTVCFTLEDEPVCKTLAKASGTEL